MARPNASHLLAVDLVRFGCALLVVAHHYATAFAQTLDSPLRAVDPALRLPGGAVAWTWFGWVGVEVFFMVSGYVIARSVDRVDVVGFLRRRVLRLAPAAWLCASLSAIVLLADSAVSPAAIVARWVTAVLLVPTRDAIDPSWWTLFIEIAFYALVALALRPDADNERRVERLGWVLGAASLTFWVVALLRPISPHVATCTFSLNLLQLPFGVCFALGIILSAADRHGWTTHRAVATAALLAGVTVELASHTAHFARTLGYPLSAGPPVAAFLIAAAVLALAQRLQQPLVGLRAARLLPTLGALTYPLYLLHQSIGAAVIVALVHAAMPAGMAMLAAAAAVIALAWLIAAGLEPRLRRWMAARIDAWLSRRHDPRPDSRPSASLRAG